MNDNLAYAEIEQLQSEDILETPENQDEDEDTEIQEAIITASLRQIDVLWLKKGSLKTHAFHKNGSLEISMCGQIVLEEIGEANLLMAKESHCPRCEKFIRRLSRAKPVSPGLKEVLEIHNQSALNEEAV